MVNKFIKKHIQWNKIRPILFISLFILIVGFFIVLFVLASGGFILFQIDTKVWGEFGSFIGAFLLAATLIFQIRSFRRQQVEAKFFEMLKYYRENISEMRFRNPFYYKDPLSNREVDEEFVVGRRVLKTIFLQYKVACKLARKIVNDPKAQTLTYPGFEKLNSLSKSRGWGNLPNNNIWTQQYIINLSFALVRSLYQIIILHHCNNYFLFP